MCRKILKLSNVSLDFFGRSTYYGMMAIVSFLLAPIFFIVFIFYSETYIEAATKSMIKQFKQDEESS